MLIFNRYMLLRLKKKKKKKEGDVLLGKAALIFLVFVFR